MPALRIDALAGAKAKAAGDHSHPLAQWENNGYTGNRGNEVSSHGGGNNGNNWTNDQERDRAIMPDGGHGHEFEGYVGSEEGVNADGKDTTGANQPEYREVLFLIRTK